jgi:hypothetical protein
MKQCHHKFGFIRDGIQEFIKEIEKRRDENQAGRRRNGGNNKSKERDGNVKVKEESKMGEGLRRG